MKVTILEVEHGMFRFVDKKAESGEPASLNAFHAFRVWNKTEGEVMGGGFIEIGDALARVAMKSLFDALIPATSIDENVDLVEMFKRPKYAKTTFAWDEPFSSVCNETTGVGIVSFDCAPEQIEAMFNEALEKLSPAR